MGCIHSAVIRKGANQGTSMDRNPHTDPSVSPGILQLAGLTGNCHSASDLKGSITSTFQKKRGSLPRSKSVELVMEQVMERHYDFDLTYITERIISVFFLPDLEEQRYRGNLQEVAAMLKSKHQDKFLLLNLSEKRHDIASLNPKVQDYGWPDHHAPPLDRICAVCKAMDTWLISDPQNVVVLHCKGNKGKTGVIVAAYMHYSKITAGADQALTTLAMRKFCEDKVSSSLQPSQNRYIFYFGGLLSGSIKMNSSPLFLQQILIPSLPNFQAEGGYYPFLKIYQSLQLVYTSGVYDPHNSRARKLCVTMEPALLLKGDIMVKCYHRRPRSAQREVVFRVQFHTCTVHGAQLWFGKTELDSACSDDRFPPDNSVEFIFSSSPDKIKGREYQKNEPSITVDYNTSDPVVRWDSYENFNLHHQDSLEKIPHTRGPLDGSLYAQVRKRRGPGSTGAVRLSLSPTVGPPTQAAAPQPPASFSSDPGRHSASPSADRPEEPSPSAPTGPHGDGGERRAAEGEDRAGDRAGRGKERDRETAILDDAEPSGGLEGFRRGGRPCCSPGAGRPGEGVWERAREPCLASNGHHPAHRAAAAAPKNNPKSRTLPALPSKPLSPTPRHAPHLELYHRHSGHPLPELPWECPPAPMLCVHRACFPHSTPELAHPHPHSYSLPASSRECSPEGCHLVHCPGHGPPSLPTSPYRELFFQPPAAPSGCGCRDCAGRREHQSASVRLFHPLHSDKSGGLHWGREVEMQQAREGPPVWADSHWEAKREAAEFWQHKTAVQPYRVCHSSLEQPQSPDQAGSVLVLHQGYRTPPPAHLSCACIPYQSSPAESHESRGYASGYQSGSSSPLAPTSPMPGASPGRSQAAESPSRARGPSENTHHTDQTAQADVKDNKSVSPSSDPDSAAGMDVDQDYTLICSPPTQAEVRITEECVDSGTPTNTPQGVQKPSHGAASSPSLESNANTDNTVSQPPQAAPKQPPCSSTDLSENASKHSQSLGLTARIGEDNKETGSAKESGQSDTSSQTTVTIQSVTTVQMQLNGSALPGDAQGSDTASRDASSGSSTPASAQSPQGSPARGSSPQAGPPRPSPGRDSPSEPSKPPSPVPEGYSTPTFPLASYYYPLLNVPHVPYTGYTAVTIPAPQPPLPEKKRFSSSPLALNGHSSLLRAESAPSSASLASSSTSCSNTSSSSSSSSGGQHHVTFSPTVAEPPALGRRGSAQSGGREEADTKVNAKFVQDSSKYWYKPGISRDQAIAVLKDKEPGSFLIRDSNSFQGAYGLALKVTTPPLNANLNTSKGDPLEQLVRHFLIETGPRGVKIKGCQNESYFGSLSALVYQHSITPISLPCALLVPDKDLVGELQEIQSVTNTSTAANLLQHGAACNVLYLNSVETESLTGPQAISKATKCTLALSPRPTATVVHFKVSIQGITLTDGKRRLFFRRHYPINSVTFSSLDPKDQRIFGFVARRTGSTTENVCHLFAEIDPEQPAVAIVNFINKVMLGPQLRR
ncbi:tensin-2-like isoform X2 [Gadus macrocephalus]|uniref:tensin-2-like isoform X2 n=1 Tax=Gadus macrocephalus TaxID=80720 RepID=UPI0028CB2DBE|nr:tensin-2-like isoform X2 [Gadus macrocephalus]